MKFRLFKRKPTGREVIEAIFSRFTAEEMAILNSESCAIPRMYSLLLQESHHLKTRLTMEEVMKVAEREIYCRRDKIHERLTQGYIFKVFLYCIFSPGKYI